MANEKTIIDEVTVRDQHGEAQPGLTTVWWYPWKTVVNGTQGTDLTDGRYRATINSVNTGKIAKYYDLYIAGAKKIEKIPIGVSWEWIIDVAVNTNPKTVTFNGLVDALQGGNLPTTIPDVLVEIMSSEKGRSFYLYDITTTNFKIGVQLGGDDNAGLPVTVRIKVTVGES